MAEDYESKLIADMRMELQNVLRCFDRDNVAIRRVQGGVMVKIALNTAGRIRDLLARQPPNYCNKCQDRPGYDGLGRTCKGCNGTGIVTAC